MGAMYPTYPGVGSGTLYPGRARQNSVSSFCLPLLLLTKTWGHARCSTLCPHIIEEIISYLAFLGIVVEFSKCPVKGGSFSTICPTLKKLKYFLKISYSYLYLFISGGCPSQDLKPEKDSLLGRTVHKQMIHIKF